MKAAFLSDRGIVKVTGEDARGFLNGLVTTDTTQVRPGFGRFGALLTPQGKIIADFLMTEAPGGHGGGFLLDCPRALAPQLAQRLGFYKLRAKVTVEDLSDSLGVLALWPDTGETVPSDLPLDLAFPDPRHGDLGWRVLLPDDVADKAAKVLGATLVEAKEYDAHRIALGVPRGGVDFIYSDAFPHETNMDRLHGVDFDKGCYVGQEVVSRMQHRGIARTRIVRLLLDEGAPEGGIEVVAADKSVGTMGSSANGRGLALLRIDRVSDALKGGATLSAGNIPVKLASHDDIRIGTTATTKATG
jgi:folate-binding protein YgfZ